MLVTVAAADSAKVQKKSTAFLNIAKRNHTLCTLYINRRVNCVFYSINHNSSCFPPAAGLCEGFSEGL